MNGWEIVLIVFIIALLIMIVAIFLCRVMGIGSLSKWFSSGEEKQSLTKHDAMNGYNGYVNSESDFALDASGKYVEYDTVKADPQYQNINETAEPPATTPQHQSGRSTPTSLSSSIASDYDIGQGLTKAPSCESIASDSSIMDIEPAVAAIGQLEFGLEFDREVSELIVSVIQARDLEVNEVTGTVDTYVKVNLAPDSDSKKVTKVQRETANPQYKERFLFPVDPDELDNKTIQFSVYSCDKYARHKLLGQCDIKLGDIDLRHAVRLWLNLKDIDEVQAEYGDIMFSLSYLPTAERLTVVIVKARNLKWHQNREAGDCFVKVYLLQNGKKMKKKKTTVKKDEKNPIFNEAMIFSVPSSTLPTVQLRITVAEQMPEGKVSSIGHIIVGANTTGTELSHWNQMMTSLRKPIAMWHSLCK
ncbi:synaptotagmin-12 [Lingula anatina]|uniref:Synaptotagmin-12 n=1 Tax=Lingula anatina TaxID=7574 RepID=A0A1S3K1X9_LINAN|nr:synaptotagmin-12 [Lingula anatina]|eukprot:XP_013416638.1 synaptotagmin-12 [Lingula anatina]